MDYIYAELNKEVAKVPYTGKHTDTAEVVVIPETDEIAVNVKKLPHRVALQDMNTGKTVFFDGSDDALFKMVNYRALPATPEYKKEVRVNSENYLVVKDEGTIKKIITLKRDTRTPNQDANVISVIDYTEDKWETMNKYNENTEDLVIKITMDKYDSYSYLYPSSKLITASTEKGKFKGFTYNGEAITMEVDLKSFDPVNGIKITIAK